MILFILYYYLISLTEAGAAGLAAGGCAAGAALGGGEAVRAAGREDAPLRDLGMLFEYEVVDKGCWWKITQARDVACVLMSLMKISRFRC